jgi:hypothetical protein
VERTGFFSDVPDRYFFALAVRSGSARFETSPKVLGAIIGVAFSGFFVEHLL